MTDNVYAKTNGLSLAALIFGILAFLGSFAVVPTPFCASLAVMFSWLSRGDKKMNGQAVAGNVLAVAAVVISLVVLGLVLTVFRVAAEAFFSMGAEMFRDLIQSFQVSM